MLENKLKKLMLKKLKYLKVPTNVVTIKKVEDHYKNSLGEIHDSIKVIYGQDSEIKNSSKNKYDGFPGEIFCAWKNKSLDLFVGDLSCYDDENLEIISEHEASHCKDNQEKVYGTEIVADVYNLTPATLVQDKFHGLIPKNSSGNIVVGLLSKEMNTIYKEYFGCKRQKSVFGEDSLEKYLLFNLEEHVNESKKFIEKGDYNTKFLSIASLYNLEVVSSLIKKDLPFIPDIIKDLTSPLVESFEKINNLNLDWINKSEILNLISIIHEANVDVIASYNKNRLQLKSSLGEKSFIFWNEGKINNITYNSSSDIERLIVNKYKGISKNESKR